MEVIQLLIYGTLLIPCNIWFQLIIEGSKNTSYIFPFYENVNESFAKVLVPQEIYNQASDDDTISGAVVFNSDISDPEHLIRTDTVVIKNKTKTSLPYTPYTEVAQNWEILGLLIVLGLFLLMITIILFYFLWNRTNPLKELANTLSGTSKGSQSDQEMQDEDQDKATQEDSKQRDNKKVYLSDLSEDQQPLLGNEEQPIYGEDDLVDFNAKDEEKQSETVSVVTPSAKENAPPTTVMSNLVNGMACSSPFDKTYADPEDNLFNLVHNVPKKKKEEKPDT